MQLFPACLLDQFLRDTVVNTPIMMIVVVVSDIFIRRGNLVLLLDQQEDSILAIRRILDLAFLNM